MTLNYVGNRQNKTRLAEFTYTEREEARFLRIVNRLDSLGYEVDTGVLGWAAVEVADRAEYDMLKADFQAARREIK